MAFLRFQVEKEEKTVNPSILLYISISACKTKNEAKTLLFKKLLLSLQHRLLALRGKAGGLIYEKDVFERLSL